MRDAEDIARGHVRLLNGPSGAPFAEVVGADLRSWASDRELGSRELRRLLCAHGLVVFRDVELSPAEEVSINELPGWHAPAAAGPAGFGWSSASVPGIATIPGQPEVLCQGNVELKDHHGIASHQLQQLLSFENEGFHADGIHNQQEASPILTSMYCISAPLAGGETYFACSRLALTAAPVELRALARRLTVHYEYDEGSGLPLMQDGITRAGRLPAKGAIASGRAAVRTAYPLVRQHHESKEEAVFLSCANISHMTADADASHAAVHLDEEASYRLVRELLGGVTSGPKLYAHRWKERDFAIWDHRLLQHAPCKEPGTIGQRLHHRVRLPGNDAANADVIEHNARRDLARAGDVTRAGDL